MEKQKNKPTEKKTGFRTITYRFRLYCDRMDWLVETKRMYNAVLGFYLDVLRQEPELLRVPKLKRMRQLELLTIGARGETKAGLKYPIPFEKVPLYFRRAAINDAIRLGEQADGVEKFDASPIYYKGMYKDFTATSVMLKLYDGESWRFVECGIDTCGRRMPEEEQMMSPIIVLKKNRAMLHVPVKEAVEDVRTVEARVADGGNVCAVVFPRKGDTIAVAAVLRADGSILASRFIHGGKELGHRKRILLARLEKNRASMGGNIKELPPEENKTIKEKIHRITDDAAHKASRDIVELCREWNVSLIIVPKNRSKIKISYFIDMKFDWLGRRISSYIKYKSFGEGIVTTTITTRGTFATCHLCGAELLVDKPDPSSEFQCLAGHRGNVYFNAAVNQGRKFLKLHEGDKHRNKAELEEEP